MSFAGQAESLITLAERISPTSAIRAEADALIGERAQVLANLERGSHLTEVEAIVRERELHIQRDINRLRAHDRELLDDLQAIVHDGAVAESSLAAMVVSRLTDNVVVHGTTASVGLLRDSLALLQRAAGELLTVEAGDPNPSTGALAALLKPVAKPTARVQRLATRAIRRPASALSKSLDSVRDIVPLGATALDRDFRRYRRAKRLTDLRRLVVFVFASLVLFELLPNVLIDLLDTGMVSARASHYSLLVASAIGIWLLQEHWLNERLDRALLRRRREDLRAGIDVLYQAAVKARCCLTIIDAWNAKRERPVFDTAQAEPVADRNAAGAANGE